MENLGCFSTQQWLSPKAHLFNKMKGKKLVETEVYGYQDTESLKRIIIGIHEAKHALTG